MITQFRVENFKALHNVTLNLTPIHVLIGPNDSGKTSILEAFRALGRAVEAGGLDYAFPGRWNGRELVWRGQQDASVTFQISFSDGGERYEYLLSCRFPERGRGVERSKETIRVVHPHLEVGKLTAGTSQSSAVAAIGLSETHAERRWTRPVFDSLSGIQSYRWVPRHLSLPVAFDFQSQFRMTESGFGLAMCLQDIVNFDHERFRDLETRFRDFFPSVARIRLLREIAFLAAETTNPHGAWVGIHFELDAPKAVLAAEQASDGLLLVLAYLALFYSPQPPRVLLIEEPENGVHPQRLKEVLGILKQLVNREPNTQVILTTHSPYVVDQFKPEEVTLCLKGADGAVTTHPLSESKSVREQMDIFKLGEIWTGEGDEALATRVG